MEPAKGFYLDTEGTVQSLRDFIDGNAMRLAYIPRTNLHSYAHRVIMEARYGVTGNAPQSSIIIDSVPEEFYLHKKERR